MHQTFPGLCQEEEDEHHFLPPSASPPRPGGLDRSSAPLSSIALLSWGQEAGFQSTGPCSAVRYAALSREDASQGRHHHKAQNSTWDFIYYHGSLWNAGERLFWYERGKKSNISIDSSSTYEKIQNTYLDVRLRGRICWPAGARGEDWTEVTRGYIENSRPAWSLGDSYRVGVGREYLGQRENFRQSIFTWDLFAAFMSAKPSLHKTFKRIRQQTEAATEGALFHQLLNT